MLFLFQLFLGQCNIIEILNRKDIIKGLITSSRVVKGDLAKLWESSITFEDVQPSIDIVFQPNILIHLSEISINSSMCNLRRFRIELLNDGDNAQYRIESSSMSVNFEALPSVMLAGIRLTFLQPTNDRQPPSNIHLSIRACVEEIIPPSTTMVSTTATTSTPPTIYTSTTSIGPGLIQIES